MIIRSTLLKDESDESWDNTLDDLKGAYQEYAAGI